ncbi:MAG: hypothetical protein M3Z02_04525 [Actinomycetota bacterium]|nr:hypothetical protein [Actinomycetota bacterium]
MTRPSFPSQSRAPGAASPATRRPALSRSYDALVAAALQVRADPATCRFDEVLAAAVADGSVDATVGRELRFWQRESVRAVVDHVETVLPVVLTASNEADRAAVDAVHSAGQSWSQAARTGHPSPVHPGRTSPDDLAVRRRHTVVAGLTGELTGQRATAGVHAARGPAR